MVDFKTVDFKLTKSCKPNEYFLDEYSYHYTYKKKLSNREAGYVDGIAKLCGISREAAGQVISLVAHVLGVSGDADPMRYRSSRSGLMIEVGEIGGYAWTARDLTGVELSLKDLVTLKKFLVDHLDSFDTDKAIQNYNESISTLEKA